MDVVTLGAALRGAKLYTDATIAPLLGGVHYRGSVNYASNLPADPSEGDAYTVKYKGTTGTEPDGTEYVWGLDTDDNTYKWIGFSPDTYTKSEVDALLSGKEDVVLVDTDANWSESSKTLTKDQLIASTDITYRNINREVMGTDGVELRMALKDNADPDDINDCAIFPDQKLIHNTIVNQVENDLFYPKQQISFNTKNGVKNIAKRNELTDATTVSGVVYTPHSDDTVTVNSTTTSGTSTVLYGRFTLSAGGYFLSCFYGEQVTSLAAAELKDSNDQTIVGVYGNDDDKHFMLENDTVVSLYIGFDTGATTTDVVFKPMVRPDSMYDDEEYQPCAKSNAELTREVAGKLDDKTTHTTINGIDVYVSNTRPTGTIAIGSVGIGW